LSSWGSGNAGAQGNGEGKIGTAGKMISSMTVTSIREFDHDQVMRVMLATTEACPTLQ
jgi:hypothetical protein